MKKAFSLIELLISLIIISLLISALIPIVTKKLNKNSALVSSSINCKKFDSSNDIRCLLCQKDKCEICNTSTIEKEGYYVNPGETCKYQKCSKKFDSACSKCNSEACLACKGGFSLIEGKCEITDTLNFKRVNDLYITRKNMGDSSILTLTGITRLPLGSSCNTSSQKCCWYGKTADICDSNYSQEYSGCERTVCNYLAAKEICSNFNYLNLKWRLATVEEMSPLASTKDDNGLWFCKCYGGSSQFSRCNNNVYTCSGATPANNQCRNNDMWASNGQCGIGALERWSCHTLNPMTVTPALSVRCVSEAR